MQVLQGLDWQGTVAHHSIQEVQTERRVMGSEGREGGTGGWGEGVWDAGGVKGGEVQEGGGGGMGRRGSEGG